MVCRRCSECRNSDHHWMDNPDFGNDDPDAEPEHNPNVSHICKHCEQEGYECGGCGGEGCEECNGAGVLSIPF